MNVVVKFYPWKKFCFPVLLGMVINVVNVQRIGKKGTIVKGLYKKLTRRALALLQSKSRDWGLYVG